MEDLIKREDAIKAVVNTPSNIADVMGNNLCLDGAVFRQNEIIDILKSIPSAERQGEWMPIIEGNEFGETYQSGIYCSECGETLGCEANFCPNCGARMKGVNNETD